MQKASTPPAPPPNRSAPTPSTRLPPRYSQLKTLRVETARLRPNNPKPLCPRFGRTRRCDVREVLVLARSSAREAGTPRTRTAQFSAENPRQVWGNPRDLPPKRAGDRDRVAIAVSNNRVNEV